QVTPDGRMHIWSTSTGRETKSFHFRDKKQLERLSGLSFLKTDQVLAWSKPCMIELCDFADHATAHVLLNDATEGGAKIGRLVVSRDSGRIAFTTGRGLHVWNLGGART